MTERERERQQKEIETIKPRTITLNLSDSDCERISIKAAEGGLTVEELLKNFIGDLTDGTYSNGSDERMYANEWFDRCGFAYTADKTMLKYIIGESCGRLEAVETVRRFLTVCAELDIAKEKYAEYKENVTDEDFDKEYFQMLKDDVEGGTEELEAWFEDGEVEAEVKENLVKESIEICSKWLNDITSLKGIE